ncbi:MAG TPA: hypothetical protein H9775_06035, partial [Candidatus Blautia merdipullorum]|nr:hypothetical protein [Candidatus Blautia merdipullorum]
FFFICLYSFNLLILLNFTCRPLFRQHIYTWSMQSTDGGRILITAHEHQKAGPDWLASPLQDTDFTVQNPILLGEAP